MVSRIQGNPRVDGMLAGSSGNNNHRLSTASVADTLDTTRPF
jgi:hypothetical protein